MANEANVALTNRALRTIRTELEFLTDSCVITPQQLSSILSQLPPQTYLHAPLQSQGSTTTPIEHFNDLSIKDQYVAIPTPAPLPPPAYPVQPQILSFATSLYAYTPSDAGDLALQPNDRIQVLEHMNNDWWRGKNERTGLEGIFPRSYVNVLDEKRPSFQQTPSTEYGNMPLAVSQSNSGPVDPNRKNKWEEQGKKFGKKMGNAAIFGAGATIGSNIVNGIF